MFSRKKIHASRYWRWKMAQRELERQRLEREQREHHELGGREQHTADTAGGGSRGEWWPSTHLIFAGISSSISKRKEGANTGLNTFWILTSPLNFFLYWYIILCCIYYKFFSLFISSWKTKRISFRLIIFLSNLNLTLSHILMFSSGGYKCIFFTSFLDVYKNRFFEKGILCYYPS